MTNQAKNNPVGRPRREINTGDMDIGQSATVNIDDRLENNDESQVVVASVSSLKKEHLADLAFMEEPVTISINKGTEKFPAKVVPCWVNGKGAEQLHNGKWMVCGWLPVNTPVTTRRKYVEVLARSKVDSYEVKTVKHDDHEDNIAIPNASSRYPFSVLHDPAGAKGYEWLSRILREV